MLSTYAANLKEGFLPYVQQVAKLFVGVGLSHPLAVGRVDDNQTRIGFIFEPTKVLEALLVNFDFTRQPSAL